MNNSPYPLRLALTATLFALLLSACASPPWIPTSGPSVSTVRERTDKPGPTPADSGIQLVQLTDQIAGTLLKNRKPESFSEWFASSSPKPGFVGRGDGIEVTVWEAPPAMLFGTVAMDSRGLPSQSQATNFPEQVVDSDGNISIPFAGPIKAAGKTLRQIEAEITDKLRKMTNRIQVVVRMTRNAAANVTVVGEVANSTRMPLTAKGERLLDALAAAGGTRQPVNKTTVQVSRGGQVRSLPLDTVIRDPQQNIYMEAADVITALHQPLSFMVLGATGKNEEINYEAQGISLTQALARAGGLQDSRSDARGVFVFRFENANALTWGKRVNTTPDGKVPVIYQIDLSDPASFFLAQSFSIENKDLLYVSNAPAAELQKFLNIVTSVTSPIFGVMHLTTR